MIIILRTIDSMKPVCCRYTYIDNDGKWQSLSHLIGWDTALIETQLFSIVVTGNNACAPDLLGDFLNDLKF